MDNREAERAATPIVKEIVNCIAERRYSDIEKYAEFEGITPPVLAELIEGYMEANELPYMDGFGVTCTFNPQYEYHQLDCVVYRDGSGFCADYDLTTDGELNDLTLNMEFLFTKSGGLQAKLLDAHVM